MRGHAASERANARTYAHTSVHLYAHVRSLVRSHVHSSVHSFALRSSPRPLATRTPYVHRVSWSFKSIVYEALKKANIYIYILLWRYRFGNRTLAGKCFFNLGARTWAIDEFISALSRLPRYHPRGEGITIGAGRGAKNIMDKPLESAYNMKGLLGNGLLKRHGYV